MSTGTIPPSSAVPAPPPPPPSGGSSRRTARFIEYERFIDEQVQKTRSHVKSVDIISSLLTLLTGGLLAMLLITLFDHWVIPGGLGFWGRTVCFVMLSAGAIWYGVRRVAPLLLRRINPLYAAYTIEQTGPTFKNSLVSFLQFRQNRTVVSDAAYESIEQHAATSLTTAPVDAAVDRSALIRIGYALLAVLIACALYKVFSPKDPLTTLGRVLLPWADITPSTRVVIEDVKPGDAVFPSGKQVAVSAQVTGIGDDEPVTLFYSTADGQTKDAAVLMAVPTDGYRHECFLPPGKERLRQDVIYRIEAGDYVTDEYQITVESAPTIVVEAIQYDYPSYTDGDLRDRRDDRGGDIKALEGTRVTIHAVANGPITRAQIDFGCNGKLGPRMTVDGNRARYTFTLRFAKDRTSNNTTGDTTADRPARRSGRPQYSSYQLKFWNKDGHDNDQQVRHVIEVTADLPPEVELLSPQEPELRVPVNGSVEMEVYAIDPDFQLSDVRITGQLDSGRAMKEIPLLAANEVPYRGKFQRRFTFVPKKFDLKAGDVVSYRPLAADNKRPGPNQSLGQSRRLVIVAARPGTGDKSPSDEPSEKKPDEKSDPKQQPKDGQPADDEKSQDEHSDDPNVKPNDSGMNDEGEKPDDAEDPSKDDQSQAADDPNEAKQKGDQSGEPGQKSPQEGEPGEENDGDGDSQDSGKGDEEPGAQDSGTRRGSNDEGADKSEAISELLDDLEKQEQENGGDSDGESPESGTEESSETGSDKGKSDKGNTDSAAKPEKGSAESDPKESDAKANDTESKGQGSEPKDSESKGGEPKGNEAKDKTGGEQGSDAEPDPTEGDPPADDSAKPGGQSKPGEGDPGKADTGKKSDDPEGSPASQGDNQARKDDGSEMDDSGKSSKDDAKTTSKSKRQSNGAKGETSGTESGGGQEGGGQNANQAGKDTAGSNEASEEGAGAAKEPGKGEVGEKAGRDAEADDPTGESGNSKGKGTETRKELSEGSSKNQPTDDRSSDSSKPQADDGKTPGGQSRQGDPVDADLSDADQSSSGPGTSRGKPGDRTDPSNDRPLQETKGDDPNLEYTKKATDLALEHLRDMMENDPERLKTILKKLNRDEAWIRKVLEETERDRRNAAGKGAASEAARQNLRNLGLRPRSRGARTTNAAADNVSGLSEGPGAKAPPKYEQRLRAFRKRAAQRSARNSKQP